MCDQPVHAFQVVDHAPGAAGLVNPFFPQVKPVQVIARIDVVTALLGDVGCDHVDIGFRYGGDEFTVILPEADEAVALRIAERIRLSFEARHFDSLTLSIGLMAYEQDRSIRSFIQSVDTMMYEAKRSGGNRVCTCKPDEKPSEETEKGNNGA